MLRAMSELDPELRKRIDSLVKIDEVVLFMKGVRVAPQCGFSAQVVEILDDYRQRFAVFDVLADEALREGMKAYSDWPTIPQLYVGGEFVGGADIIAQMHQSGELEQVLGPKRARPPTPEVQITPAAAEQVRAAMADIPDDVLRLAIDYRYHNDLSIGPAEEDDVVVESNGVALHFDPKSALKAHGLKLDYVTNAQGTGFKIDNPLAPPAVQELSVEGLAEKLEAGVRVFDVRTPQERATAKIEGTELFDADAQAKLEGLERTTPLVFHCHHGGRSQRAAEQAIGMGFAEVYNVVGGIDAWSQRVDPKVPRY